MARAVPTLLLADPKGLMREAFRIEGITAAECRSIFLDWALSLAPGVDPQAAMAAVLAAYGDGQEAHPMRATLCEGMKSGTLTPGRRGGWRGRKRPGSGS
jgi:hypothetical protein